MAGPFLALLLAALLCAPASAYEPEGYPGSSWGEASRDFDGIEGTGVIGNINQGVRWITLPGDLALETYAGYNLRVRTQNRFYYNAHGPALGLSLKRSPFEAGFDFSWSRFPERSRTFNNYEMFLTWYKKWNLARRLEDQHPLGIVGLPFSTWGKLYHDLEGSEGDGSMGNVKQGIDWVRLPGGVVVTTFGAFRWRLRTEEIRWFNAHGPAAGVELSHGPVSLGIEHTWQWFPELKRLNKTLRFYLTWYVSWDLKKLGGRR